MAHVQCPNCLNETHIVVNHQTGDSICEHCGTVAEESAVVAEVSFSEAPSGRAGVYGQFISQGATHARTSGPHGNKGSTNSREQTIHRATTTISQIGHRIGLDEQSQNRAARLYTLALDNNFTKGRNSMNVCAVCLYTACRQRGSSTVMLIDFSDVLQVNVFELGHIYLQLAQTLSLHFETVDPAHYIARFAALLEFGDATVRVATDATRVVQRLSRDWITSGRRPAGICGAALLIAARMNNFRRSVEEIVQVVKIADTTLRKRLVEFGQTPSGQLTLADFRTVWLEASCDPPSYTKGKDAEEVREREATERGDSGPSGDKEGPQKAKKRKRGASEPTAEPPASEPQNSRAPVDPVVLNQGILAGIVGPPPATDTTVDSFADPNIDPVLLSEPSASQHGPPISDPLPSSSQHSVSNSIQPTHPALPGNEEPPSLDSAVLAEEVTSYLNDGENAAVLAESEQRDKALMDAPPADTFVDLDEEELDAFLLSPDEVKIKERVWIEMNRDYLEALAAKSHAEATGTSIKPPRKRRKAPTPRDSTNPAGRTAAEAASQVINKFSRKINYEVANALFNFPVGGAVDPNTKGGMLVFGNEEDKDDEDVGAGGTPSAGPSTPAHTATEIGEETDAMAGVEEADEMSSKLDDWRASAYADDDEPFQQEV